MSGPVVFVAGSPASSSRSSFVAGAVEARLREEGFPTRSFSFRDFDPADLLLGRADAPALAAFIEATKDAPAIVLSSPVYKATYAGALKVLIDLVPPDALVGKPALGIATTRQPAHGPEVSRAYLALFGFFRAFALDAVVVQDEELKIDGTSSTLLPAARERVDAAGRALAAALRRT